jgi:hypothetical protein
MIDRVLKELGDRRLRRLLLQVRFFTDQAVEFRGHLLIKALGHGTDVVNGLLYSGPAPVRIAAGCSGHNVGDGFRYLVDWFRCCGQPQCVSPRPSSSI